MILHLFALVVVAVTAGSLAAWAFIRDPVDGRLEFGVLAAAVVLWTGTVGWMMYLSSDIGLRFGYLIQTFLQWVIPSAFLVFVFNYSKNQKLLGKLWVKAYLAVPGVLLLFAFTNPVHGLIFERLNIITQPFGRVAPIAGPLYYFGWLYTYVSLFIGLVILARVSVQSKQVARRQVYALAASVVVVVVTSALQLVDAVPVAGFSYTIIAFGGFYAALGYLFLRDPALDIGPLARQRLVESIDSGMIVLTSDHNIADYNHVAEKALPDLSGAVGEPVEKVIPELFEELPENEPPVPTGTKTLRLDNEQYEFSVDVSEVAEGDDTRGYGVLLSDVTEIRDYARQLEEKADQLDQFASMVSHDLRSPISVAQTNIGFVAGSVEDDSVLEYAEEAHESLGRAEELIDDLLTLAREGRSIQDREYINMGETVGKARGTSPLSPDQCMISDEMNEIDIYADEERLRTVFENLMRNAEDHAGEDVTVQVGLLDGDREGFYIEDSGQGIPESEVDEVLDHGFTTHEDGTGLGLSIVSSIVDAHGWEIGVVGNGPELGGARFEVDAELEPN